MVQHQILRTPIVRDQIFTPLQARITVTLSTCIRLNTPGPVGSAAVNLRN